MLEFGNIINKAKGVLSLTMESMLQLLRDTSTHQDLCRWVLSTEEATYDLEIRG